MSSSEPSAATVIGRLSRFIRPPGFSRGYPPPPPLYPMINLYIRTNGVPPGTSATNMFRRFATSSSDEAVLGFKIFPGEERLMMLRLILCST